MPKPLLNWRHQYDVQRDTTEGELAGLKCEDESLTQQHFTEDADINVLAKRFGLTEIPLGSLDPALFRDTTQDPDLRDVLDIQREAKERFLTLPAKLRKRFHNSPRELWDFVNDPENAEEVLRLGILSKIQEEKPSAKKDGASEKPDEPSDAREETTGSKPSSTPTTGKAPSTSS